jgi:serine protease AprX
MQQHLSRLRRGRVWRHRPTSLRRHRPKPLIGAVAALATLSLLATPVAGTSASESNPATSDQPVSLSMTVASGEPVPLSMLTESLFGRHGKRYGTGSGVDVAIIDSGVTRVAGLDQPGKVFYGPDLSNEGGLPNLTNLDTYGHGTHLAGIIAGDDGKQVVGIAPDSRLVSLKVAGATGETDVAQVIAAIDWVVEHKNDNGLNIRVLNLAFGVPGVTSNVGDPLSAAVERAWGAGIVVVAAVGNRGNDVGGVDSPAISPYVLAVGAVTQRDSLGWLDEIPSWTSGGNGVRDPDVLAPGRSIQSFRVPGSMLDQMYPTARVGERYFLGSGTSQSAAVVSGYVASLLSVDSSLSPDQVKYLFKRYAHDMKRGSKVDGDGKIDPRAVLRGSSRIRRVPQQNFPHAWSGVGANGAAVPQPTGASWSGGTWVGASWSGGTWSGASWSGASWSGASWSGGVWSGASWSSASWSGASWSGASWSGASWSGASWSGASWSSASWSSASWSGVSWSGEVWE